MGNYSCTSTSGRDQAIQLFLLIMTFLLESTSRVTMALHVGSMVLFKVCSMILNMMKNMGEWWEITLLLWYTVYCRDRLLTWREFSSQGILVYICNTWAHHDSNRRWLCNYYSSSICTTANFMHLWFNTAYLHLFIFLSTVNDTMHSLYLCVSCDKFAFLL